jgi:TP901 family phage tail tape measure protein
MADIQSNIFIDIETAQAIAKLKGLQAEISAFHVAMAKGTATNVARSAEFQRELVNGINRTGQFSAQMARVATSTETFTRALEGNKLSMGEYFRYAGASTKTFGKFFRSEFETINKVARERVKTLQTQYIKMGRDASGAMQAIAVRPVALDLENYATKAMMAAQKQQLFNQLLRQGSTNLLNFGKNTQWAGRQLMVGFSIPLAMLGTVAAQSFLKMEEQAIRFKRVYGELFTTAEETDKMAKSIQDLAKEFTKYGVAVEATMGLAADAAAMGKMGNELLDQVTQATRLAVLGGVEQQQALETTISVTNAFGVATEDLAGKIDFLNAVENQTVVSIEDLTEAIPKAGPVVQQLGGDVEDLAFFLTAMKEGGINASEGANALKSGLASLINPSRQATEMLAGFGINLSGIVEANAGDVKGTVIEFAQALDTLDPLNRARAIEQLFGKFQFSRISTLFQNVVAEGSQAARVLDLAAATSEELAILSERELSRVEESTGYKFKKAMEDIKASLAPVGEEFLKLLTPILGFVNRALEWFNNLEGGVKTFVLGAIAVIGGLGPVFLMTFGLIANGAANLLKLFGILMGVFTGTGNQSKILGMQTQYMSQEQLEAAAIAASLDQTHNKLIQTFTTEAGAVNRLTQAYQKAAVAQRAFSGPIISGGKTMSPKKMAKGGFVPGYATGVTMVPGPKGKGDIVPAMLSPGEAVIPADMAEQYRPMIAAMIAGKIPGFEDGTGSVGDRGGPSAIRRQTNRAAVSPTEAAERKALEDMYRKRGFSSAKAIAAADADMKGQASHIRPSSYQMKYGGKTVRPKGFEASALIRDTAYSNQYINDLQTNLKNKNPDRRVLDRFEKENKLTPAQKRELQNIRQGLSPSSRTGAQVLQRVAAYDVENKPRGTALSRSEATATGLSARLATKGSQGFYETQGQRAYDPSQDQRVKEQALTTAKTRLDRDAAKTEKKEKSTTERNKKTADTKEKISKSEANAAKNNAKTASQKERAAAAAARIPQPTAKTMSILGQGGVDKAIAEGKNPNRVAGQVAKAAPKTITPTTAKAQQAPMSRMGGIGGAGMMAGMAAGMMSTVPGKTGDVAGQLAGPLMAASMAFMMMPPAAAAVVTAIGSVGYAMYKINKDFKETQKQAISAGKALGASNEAIQGLAEFAGRVSATEYMDRVRSNKGQLITAAPGKTTFGESYVESETGRGQVEVAREAIARAGGNTDAFINQLSQQLSTAIISGALSQDEARSIAGNIGYELGDMDIAFKVNAQIVDIFGPNGEKLTEGGVAVIATKLAEESEKSLSQSIEQLETNLGAYEFLNTSFERNLTVGGMGAAGAGVGAGIGSLIAPGVGTVIGTAVGGIAGSVGGYFVVKKAAEEIAALSGVATANLINSVEQIEQLGDAVDVYYIKKLEEAKLEGDITRQKELQIKYDEERIALATKEAEVRGFIKELFLGPSLGEGTEIAGNLGQYTQDLIDKPFVYTDSREDSVMQPRQESEGATWFRTWLNTKPAWWPTAEDPTSTSSTEGTSPDLTTEGIEAFSTGIENALQARFQNDPTAQLYLPVINEMLKTQYSGDVNAEGKDISGAKADLVRLELATGGLDPAALNSLLMFAGQDEGRQDVVFNIVTEFGGSFATETSQILNLIGGDELKADVALRISNSANQAEAQDLLDFVGEVTAFGGVIETDIELNYFLNNPEAKAEFQAVLDRLENEEVVTVDQAYDVNPKLRNPEAFDAAYFESLPDVDKEEYVKTISMILALDTAVLALDQDFRNWLNENNIKTPLSGGTESWLTLAKKYQNAYAQGTGFKVTDERSLQDTTTGEEGTTPPVGGGGGPTNVYAPIEKGMGQFVDGAKKVSKSSAQALRDIQKFADSAAGVFNGIANQMRDSSVGEPLIDFMLGMDPDEFEKEKTRVFTIENGLITGLTAAGEALQAALNTAKLGEFVNEQDKLAVNAESQLKAFKMMTAAGIESEYAYKLVQDTAFATALATEQSQARIDAALDSAKRAAAATAELETAKAKADPRQERRERLADMNKEFADRQKFITKMKAQGNSLTNIQIEAIANNKDLMEEFLATGWDGKKMSLKLSSVLRTALLNAAKQEEIDLAFKKLTVSGMQEIFDQGFGNAQTAFSVLEEQLSLELQGKLVFGDESYADAEKVVEAAQEQIGLINFEIDGLEADLERISRQEDEINEKYDDKLEALEKIGEANERITRQQESQLNIADALSRGDIAGAARAIQEARAATAREAQERQKEILEKQRQAELGAVRGTSGLSREQLEEQIKKLREEIFNIEQDIIRPREEVLRLADLQLTKDIESLEVLGMSREEWNNIKNQIDLAKISTDKYLDSLREALSVMTDLTGTRGEMLNPDWIKNKDQMEKAKAEYDKAIASGASSKEIKRLKKVYDAANKRFDSTAKYVSGENPDWRAAKNTEDAAYTAWQNSITQKLASKEQKRRKKTWESARSAREALPQYAAGGGSIEYLRMGGMLPYKAMGGSIFKSINTDTVPAMLTPGEFVITRSAVERFGENNLRGINNGTYGAGSMYNYSVEINVKSQSDASQIADTVIRQIKRIDSQRVRGNKI